MLPFYTPDKSSQKPSYYDSSYSNSPWSPPGLMTGASPALVSGASPGLLSGNSPGLVSGLMVSNCEEDSGFESLVTNVSDSGE